MHIELDALVAREVDYKESDKILTVLTREEGRLTVSARGARREGSACAAATQLLCRSRMLLSERLGRFTLTEAEIEESFVGLRRDIAVMALASYIADVAGTLMPEGQPSPDVYDLTLNALRALDGGKRPHEIIKGAFELAALALSGYAPHTDVCAVCGGEPDTPYFDVHRGAAVCGVCSRGAEPLTRGAWDAVMYVLNSAHERVFSFTLNGDDLALFSAVCEKYLLAQLDRPFSTLEFYKGLLK